MALRHLLCLVAALAGIAAAPATAAAQRIENTATLNFSEGDAQREIRSNTTRIDRRTTISPTDLAFYVLPPNQDLSQISCVPGPPQMVAGQPFTADQYAGLSMDDAFGSPSFAVVLQDPTGNRDPEVRETVVIDVSISSGDEDLLMLTETAPDSGIFAGGFTSSPTPSADDDCSLTIPRGATVTIRYAGDDDSASSSDTILIDPFGVVFDSATGVPVDGVRITLIDDATGRPADVFGDDGVSRYPSSVISGEDVVDAGGTRYNYGPGEYRFPLTAPGSYHFVFETPGGYSAPSTVPIANLGNRRNRNYVVNPVSYGQSFALVSPAPVRIDIPVDPIAPGMLLLEKTASAREASPGDFVQYVLRLSSRQTATLRAATVTDTLPAALRYKRGSTRNAPEPAVSGDGRTLVFMVGDLAPSQVREVRYVAEVTPGARVGEATNRAIPRAGGLVGTEASVSVRIRPLLFTGALTIVGRVTEGRCGDPGRKGVPRIRLLMEDGTYAVTDREGLYHFEGVRAGRHVVQLDTRSLSPALAPVACDPDTRSAGSVISQFVEGTGGSLQRVDFQLRRTGIAPSAIDDSPIAVADDAIAAGGKTDWLLGQAPGIEWLFPEIDHNPRAPALRVVIKHRPGQRVALTIAGVAVDPLAFDGADSAGAVAVSRWTGLPLKEGDNRLEARVLDPSGAVAATLSRTVHYANTPVRAAFVPEHSRLVADGFTTPLVAVRLTDRDGRPVRAGAVVPFRVDQPYIAAQAAELRQGRQLAGLERADPTVRVVGDDGLAFVALQPTTQTGAARITFKLTQDDVERISELRPWLSAGAQEWVVVGFGAGSVGYDTLSARTRPEGNRHDVITDGQLSFYAKGRIKGSWLLTIAYDSERKRDPDRGLLSVIDPDRYYTVYGDGSAQAYDASTNRKLYLRLERREFYALFGDYETGLVDTRLTRFSRTLNGVKTGYQGRAVSFAGFAAHSGQRFARDEIQGNGLSGPYRLSAGRIVPNSDKVSIEVRDRFRSEKIVETKLLARHIDYDVDPDAGTLRFRSPVLTRDADLNPVFIVVDYELDGAGDRRVVAGGRVAARIAKGAVEVGATYLRDASLGKAAVGGVDLKARPFANTEIRVEAATGGRQGLRRERAFLVEGEHHGKAVDLLAYLRQQDEGFGIGQQNIAEAGTRKYGADGRLKIDARLALIGSAWREEALVGPASRSAADFKLEYRDVGGTLFAGVQGTSDHGIDGERRESRLLTLGATRNLLKKKLILSAETQFALGGDDASVDFPVRHRLAASYAVTDAVRILASHEIADGARFTAHTTQTGFDLTPWAGAKLATTLNQQAIRENGERSYAQFGLGQSLPIGRRWTVDATLDASTTVRGRIPAGGVANPFHPVASGGFLGRDRTDGDYRSATLGATYRAALWSWNGRVELRRADDGNRWGVTSNLIRTLGEGKTIASGIRAYREGAGASFASADVALALRPLDSRWSLLERLEFRHERAGTRATTRLINNLAVNYRTDPLEASFYYGSKYVRGRFDDDLYAGYIDAIGVEIRRDLAKNVDIGVAASMQHAWGSGAKSYSVGPSLGLSPAKDSWVTLGYNLAGYHDRDFDAARYTRQGPYLTLKLKFDQTSLGNAFRGAAR